MFRKVVMGLPVAAVVVLVTAMVVPRFDLAFLWLSDAPGAPSVKRLPNNAKTAPPLPSSPSESAETAPNDSKFDVVRIDPEGASVFAGRAPANTRVTVLANGVMVATTKADENGQWASVIEQPFAPGEYQLSLRTKLNASGTESMGESVRITVAAGAHSRRASSSPTKAAALWNETIPSPPAPITFAYNGTNLTPAGLQQAAALREFLNEQGLASVTLSGHADERGSDEYNMELSRQRLETVARYLREFGYRGELKLVPMGKSEPYLTRGRDRLPKEDAFQLDRRVELHLRQR
jgi:outer membrane protein OmpA-like peptidoglycan-associated protein